MKMTKNQIRKTKQEVKEFIRTNWPPGTLLRHKKTGVKCMIGRMYYKHLVWMLNYSNNKKGTVTLTQAKEQFELWTDETL